MEDCIENHTIWTAKVHRFATLSRFRGVKELHNTQNASHQVGGHNRFTSAQSAVACLIKRELTARCAERKDFRVDARFDRMCDFVATTLQYSVYSVILCISVTWHRLHRRTLSPIGSMNCIEVFGKKPLPIPFVNSRYRECLCESPLDFVIAPSGPPPSTH